MTTEVTGQRTTVRFKTGPSLLVLRGFFRALERCAPRAGGAIATRMWCTPPTPRRRDTNPPGPAPSGRETGGGEVVTVPVNGRVVKARSWGAGPIVYLVHGWGGWRGQLEAFVAPLVAEGFRVISYDALSHGDSEPGALGAGRSSLPELATTLDAVVDAIGPAHAVIGHSLGGSATAVAVLDGTSAGRLVFIGSLADPIGYTREFARAFGFGERIRSEMLRRLELETGRASHEYELVGRLAAARAGEGAARLPALLVVHDQEDKEVSHADGCAIAAAWPGAELVTTRGLGHRRILRDTEVIKRVTAFVAGT